MLGPCRPLFLLWARNKRTGSWQLLHDRVGTAEGNLPCRRGPAPGEVRGVRQEP